MNKTKDNDCACVRNQSLSGALFDAMVSESEKEIDRNACAEEEYCRRCGSASKSQNINTHVPQRAHNIWQRTIDLALFVTCQNGTTKRQPARIQPDTRNKMKRQVGKKSRREKREYET